MAERRKPLFPGNSYEQSDGSLNFAGFFQRTSEVPIDPLLAQQQGFATIVTGIRNSIERDHPTPLQAKWREFLDACRAIFSRLNMRREEGDVMFDAEDPADRQFCISKTGCKYLEAFFSQFEYLPKVLVTEPVQDRPIKNYFKLHKGVPFIADKLFVLSHAVNSQSQPVIISTELKAMINRAESCLTELRSEYQYSVIRSPSP